MSSEDNVHTAFMSGVGGTVNPMSDFNFNDLFPEP